MNSTNDDFVIGHYLVAFVDLLGQREKLKKFNALPTDQSSAEYQEFVKLVYGTIGAVDDLQQICREWFGLYGKSVQDGFSMLPPEAQKYNKTEIKFQHFSDGLVIYVPLKENDDYLPAKSVYAALATCGMLCLRNLVLQRPIRIGVAIGIAAELRENELYGKAVVDAYEAESFVAQYPRVVVTNEVIDYLKERANRKCEENDIDCKMNSGMAQSCLKLLSIDCDGRLIVDYLGDFFRNPLLAGENDALCHEAFKFVTDELAKHKKAQNTKLAFRYSLLQRYFFEHLENVKAT